MSGLPLVARRHVGRFLLGGYAAFCLLYLGSHALRLRAPFRLQPSAFDLAVPLLPASIWLYFSQFVLLPLAIVCARDDAARSRVFYAALLATLLAALVFLCLPTELARPSIAASGATGWAWSALFATDTDGNCFPSLHVALAALAGAALWQRGWHAIALLWPALIAGATLTTKQHVIWDIVGGLVLAAIAWTLIPRWIRHD